MKAPPFAYVRAASLADVFRLWSAAGPEAKLLAGGQTLLATLAFRLSDPGTLIDISRVAELDRHRASRRGDPRRRADDARRARAPASSSAATCRCWREAVPLIAHPAIRNRGTIGGSLAFADPAAELPACCVALEATIVARTAAGERRIPAAQFFTGLYATALAANELIAAVEFPVAKARRALPSSWSWRGAPATTPWPASSAKAKLAGSTLVEPRLVFFGVGDRPVSAERATGGRRRQDRDARRRSPPRRPRSMPISIRPPICTAAREMKRHLARVLLARALRRLTGTEEARAA